MAQVTNLEAVFVVDESGSMAGEQDFLEVFVPDFDQQLGTLGVSGLYGLVGYGAANPLPRQVPVGGNQFGTAQELALAAQGLAVSGGFEDGYQAIDFALRNYGFTPGANTSRIIVLVTDEDRDVGDPAVTLTTIQQLLTQNDVVLNGILNQTITDQAGTPAIGADADSTFIDANGDGVPEVSTAPILGAAEGLTTEEYSNPILAGGACIADLNILRAGGTGAQAFAQALLECLIQVVRGDGAEPALLNPIAVNAILFTDQHFSDLMMRLHGRLQSVDGHPLVVAQGPTAASDGAIQGLVISGGSGSPMVINAAADAPPVAFESRYGPFRVFLNASGHFTNVDSFGDQPGYDQSAGSVTGGADLDIGPNALVGVALGFSGGTAEAEGSDSEVDTEMLSAYLYGSARIGETGYVNAAISYASTDYEIKRDAGGATESGDTEGDQFAAFAELGMDFPLASIILTPSIGGRYLDLSVDDYTDSGDFAVGDQDYDVFTGIAKLKAATVIPQEWGHLLPEMTVAGTYDFDRMGETIDAGLVGSDSSLRVGDFGRFNLILNPAIAASSYGRGIAGRLEYKATINDDFVDHAIIGRIRIALN